MRSKNQPRTLRRTAAALAVSVVSQSVFALAQGQPTPNPAAAPTPKDAAPAAPAPGAPGDGAAPGAGATSPEGAYTVRLHDLEQRVNDLKEQIFRSKARLNLLKETVLHGVIAGSRSVIIHRNDMGALYQPVRIVYALDGAEIFSRSDENGKLFENAKELEVYNGSLAPGNHTLSAMIVYRGNGFGVFSYLRGYQWRVVKSYNFTAPEGKVLSIKAVGYEKGNALTTDPKDRPDIDFRSNSEAEGKKAK